MTDSERQRHQRDRDQTIDCYSGCALILRIFFELIRQSGPKAFVYGLGIKALLSAGLLLSSSVGDI
jgi:hypothetical protein